MTDKLPPEDKTLPEDERDVQRRFQETLGNLLNTPHKPHAPLKPATKRKAKTTR